MLYFLFYPSAPAPKISLKRHISFLFTPETFPIRKILTPRLSRLALATDDPIQIRAELLNILLAGRDTTAGLLSNTFYVLARRPDVWAKLKTEVDQLEGKRPDYETLRGMKYLKYVLNECKFPHLQGLGIFCSLILLSPTLVSLGPR